MWLHVSYLWVSGCKGGGGGGGGGVVTPYLELRPGSQPATA